MGFQSNARPDLFSNGEPIDDLDSFGISYNNYQRALLNAEVYAPLGSKLTYFSHLQTGINFNYRQSILNDFMVGGLNQLVRNQITFAGLEEGTIFTPSVGALQMGLRYELYNNLYLIARSNALLNNFISTANMIQKPNFISGHSLTFAYHFALGPLEISAMYCDQSQQIRSYINLGISF